MPKRKSSSNRRSKSKRASVSTVDQEEATSVENSQEDEVVSSQEEEAEKQVEEVAKAAEAPSLEAELIDASNTTDPNTITEEVNNDIEDNRDVVEENQKTDHTKVQPNELNMSTSEAAPCENNENETECNEKEPTDVVNRKSLDNELKENIKPAEGVNESTGEMEISMADGDLTDSQICDETKKADKFNNIQQLRQDIEKNFQNGEKMIKGMINELSSINQLIQSAKKDLSSMQKAATLNKSR